MTEPRSREDGAKTNNIIGTLRDITAEKQFELELRLQVEQRTRELQDKTRQLESFIYTIAHDLRAPLRAINGYAEIAADEFPSGSRSRTLEYLERIKASTRRLDQLIGDLLAYSRITQVGFTLGRVELCAVIRSTLRELESEIERTGAIVSVQDGLPSVRAEQSMLEQVLVNLLSNALKFSPPGQPAHVTISAEQHDGQVRLNVRDRGIGIAPEYHHRIFKVFERLQVARDFPGTGIGLAIVAKGIERLGGRYGVESSPGQGSTFWIELPTADP